MTIEERLSAVMHAHDHEAPTEVPWPVREVRPVHRRPHRRIALSALLIAVLVACGAWMLLAWPHPATTTTPAASTAPVTSTSPPTPPAPLSCPTRRPAAPSALDVPQQPTVPDAAQRLVPTGVPESAIVCGYVLPGLQGMGTTPVALTGSVELRGDLRAVPAALSALPPADPNAGGAGTCLDHPRDIDDDAFLIGLTYPDGIVWLSVIGDSCVGTGNGEFLTASNTGELAAAWLADGTAGPSSATPTTTAPTTATTTPSGPATGSAPSGTPTTSTPDHPTSPSTPSGGGSSVSSGPLSPCPSDVEAPPGHEVVVVCVTP